MKEITKSITTTTERVIYVADDGREFTNTFDCKVYERNLEHHAEVEAVSQFMIHNDGFVPCDGGEYSENHYYKWYKIENEYQLALLNKAFNIDEVVMDYPEYICIEQYDEYNSEAYSTNLTYSKTYVEAFFRDGFNIEVTFTKINN